jgi:hypothetical protein
MRPLLLDLTRSVTVLELLKRARLIVLFMVLVFDYKNEVTPVPTFAQGKRL